MGKMFKCASEKVWVAKCQYVLEPKFLPRILIKRKIYTDKLASCLKENEVYTEWADEVSYTSSSWMDSFRKEFFSTQGVNNLCDAWNTEH